MSHFLEPATGAVTLSAKVKALTQFILDGTALPDLLAQQGNVMLAFLGGTAASSMLYGYLYRNRVDRAKIKLAVFHITRVIENTPEYHARLNRPHELVRVMREEVKHMMNVHLNEEEAASTTNDLKRKLWTEVDEQRAIMKRRKSREAACKDSMVEDNPIMQETQAASVRSPPKVVPECAATSSLPLQEDGNVPSPDEKQEIQDIAMVDIEESFNVRSTPPPRQTTCNYKTFSPQQAPSSQQVPCPRKTASLQFPQYSRASGRTPISQNVLSQSILLGQRASSSPNLPARPPTRRARYGSSPPPTSKATPSSIGRSTYNYTYSSESEVKLASPCLESRSKVQSSPGYGRNYDDEHLYSSSSPSVSARSSPTSQRKSTNKPPNMLQLALKRAGLESKDFQRTPVKLSIKQPVPEKPKAIKPPSTVQLQQPPNSMTVRTGNEDKGTWLHPVQEGASPHESPATDVTRMHVAESRPFYRLIEAERKTRQSFREFFNAGEKIEQAREDQVEAAQEIRDVQWPDPTFTTSSSGEEIAVDVIAALSPLRSIESPPSAPEISPPLSSPPDDPQTPKMCSPPSTPVSDLPQSDINFSSAMTPDIIRVATPPNRQENSPAPVASSLPTEKRGCGRPRKEQKSDTPMPAKCLGRPKKVTKGPHMSATPAPNRRFRHSTAEPQTPAQAETPSGRSARKSAFKGSYKY